MSRGNRETTSGNLKSSMRANYSEHGVEEYYRRVGATYRNPHFPGVRSCLFLWLNRWWTSERGNVPPDDLVVFDMACGHGEVTLSIMEWWNLGRMAHEQSHSPRRPQSEDGQRKIVTPRRETVRPCRPPPIGPEHARPTVLAADPYTAEAYHIRTKLTCAPLSFREIAEGSFPDGISQKLHRNESDGDQEVDTSEPSTQTKHDRPPIDMVICSFALHLIESSSELFALLWMLSTKCRWLVILAPHKKPDIKDGWGWCKWNVETWSESSMSDTQGELLQERVHCRIYRSLNV